MPGKTYLLVLGALNALASTNYGAFVDDVANGLVLYIHQNLFRSIVAVLVIIQPEIWFQLTDFGSCAIASHHVALILPQPFSAYTRIQDDTSTRHQVHLPREQPQEQA